MLSEPAFNEDGNNKNWILGFAVQVIFSPVSIFAITNGF
jgi:hypothetical protein